MTCGTFVSAAPGLRVNVGARGFPDTIRATAGVVPAAGRRLGLAAGGTSRFGGEVEPWPKVETAGPTAPAEYITLDQPRTSLCSTSRRGSPLPTAVLGGGSFAARALVTGDTSPDATFLTRDTRLLVLDGPTVIWAAARSLLSSITPFSVNKRRVRGWVPTAATTTGFRGLVGNLLFICRAGGSKGAGLRA